ncbi:MAG: lipoprotein [Gammaproteobacteria bacterium]|nr:lipoprotein [Gammaproteobacteria bacterium]
MKRKILWILGSVCILGLLGCGQKGPLKPAQSPPSDEVLEIIYAD